MKELELEPNKIVVPGEYEIYDHSKLKIYHRIFKSGYGKCLPKIIVTDSNVISTEERRERLYNVASNLRNWAASWEYFNKKRVDKKIESLTRDYSQFEELI